MMWIPITFEESAVLVNFAKVGKVEFEQKSWRNEGNPATIITMDNGREFLFGDVNGETFARIKSLIVESSPCQFPIEPELSSSGHL